MTIKNINIYGGNLNFENLNLDNEKIVLGLVANEFPIGSRVKWSGHFGIYNEYQSGVNEIIGYDFSPYFCRIILSNGKKFHAINLLNINENVKKLFVLQN